MISKKTRNTLISRAGVLLLGCTLIFGLSNPSTTKADDKKVKKVIYLIADGMSDGILTAAKYYNDIQDGTLGNDKLAMDDIRSGFVKTAWANGPITDSAPAGTALSSGYKANPGVVGLNTEGQPKATILEAAELNGLATGIIATSEITHATPAAFSSHVESRQDYNSIMKQQVYKDMEVVLGGGSVFFEATGGGKRDDGKDLTEDIKALGYDYVTNKSEMNESDSDKLWGLFAERDLAYDFDRVAEGNEEEPSLAEMTEKAIEVLEKDEEGFILMVEGSKIDWAAHANDPAGTIGDILAFDDAIKVALDYAKENQDTIVVVTTDHANSGFSIGNESTTSGYDDLTFEESIMQIKDFKLSAEKFTALVEGKSDEEVKALIKEYYGYSDITAEELEYAKTGKINEVMKIRAKLGYTTGGHTGGDVYLGVYAPAGVEKLRGTVDNTELPKYMASNLGLNLDSASETLYQDIKSKLEVEGATFEVNTDDVENPYFLIAKEDKTLKVIANSNIVEVSVAGEKIEDKELSSVSILAGDVAYGNGDEIIEILNEEVSDDTVGDDVDGDNNGSDSGSGSTGNSGTNKPSTKPNCSKLPETGAVVGSGIVALLGVGSIVAGMFTSKKKKK
ncbi:alkaline phosphatase [Clostridium sp. D53t1_180928_C8]|uniref:alkaline phosphatase n=1 Tax=Clostridium sp. D53t1_180928_C8 TaxID=2787101 RepID=UPI0018AA718D|nr:alkaline phosphatase [Clostridium sp. D53t1_180928_C8]